MRKLLTLGVVTAAALFAPAAAQAHHVDYNKSKAACVLVNNVPTLQVDVVFVDFEEYNKPVSWTITINGVFDSTGLESWPAAENPHTQHWTKAVAASSTSYAIVYSAHWGRGFTASLPFETVVCPQPVPPPVVWGCDGKIVPPGSPMPVCQPVTPPPTIVTPPTPPAPPVTPAPCILTRVHSTRVTAKLRSTITVRLQNAAAGTAVTLKLPHRKAIVKTSDATGVVVFTFRSRHSGYAKITGAECGGFRAKIRKPKRPTSHRPPRTVG
jgi:hypothetical protein